MAGLPHPRLALLAALLAALPAAGCSDREEGAFDVAWIGDEQTMLEDGLRLSPGAQHLRAATQSGLVALDAQAEVVPALAERWIITDDGLSFIFRLREATWPDGDEMTSDSVRRALERTIRELDGTSLGLDLEPVEDIRAMTGRVIEIRLSAPVPHLLRLLAQPELAMRAADGGTGPMTLATADGGGPMILRFKPPQERGLPEMPDWQMGVRDISFTALDGAEAIARFDDGDAAIVLGGRLDHLPLVDTGPLSRGTVRIDAAIGLFGLRVRYDDGLLADATLREALAMAIDRNALMAPYNVGGWAPTTRIVQPGLPGDQGSVPERWVGQSIEQRREIAAARVREWRAGQARDGAEETEGEAPAAAVLSVAMGASTGNEMLLRDLARQWSAIGVELVRAEDPAEADLLLVDRVARYADPFWFLNQFRCSLRNGMCDEDADYLMELAQEALDPVERATLLAEAEAELAQANIYLPIGAPLRWSLVRGNVEGFVPNQYAFHPLPPMAELPR